MNNTIYILVFFLGIVIGCVGYGKIIVEPDYFIMGGIIILTAFILSVCLYIKRLMKNLDKAYGLLELNSTTDDLTGVFNRNNFYNQFEKELSRCIRYKRKICCQLIDIDFFSKINDQYGNQTGNEILRELAEMIKDNLRASDIVARYDSNRFICIMPETDLDSALLLSKRLRVLVEGEKFSINYTGMTTQLTISIGVTSWKPAIDKEINVEKMISLAEKALYIAKENGRNRVECYII
jgi:two-component system, cell cycle response regulator